MTDLPVTRHFATIPLGRFGARQVHYRRAGTGPCLLLLHQSPLSSRDLLPAIERWKHQFTCIAPDTPGYGLSDPFGVPDVTMDDIADAVVEFLDALGIERCAVYGYHTGAMIAGALAARWPERVSGVAANGWVVLTEAERRDFLEHYLPPFEPRWDGGHLTWLWARLREQTIFFPWYRRELAARLEFDVPSPEALTASAVDFMRAGDHYRVGYRAAFAFRSDEALRALRVPMLVTASEADPLHAHLARVRHAAGCVEVQSGGATPDAALERCRAFLAKHGAPAAPAPAPTAPLPGRTWNQMLDLPGGQLRLRRNDDAPGRTVVVQHDAASASDTVDRVSRSLVGHRPVLAFDLPGHGESDNLIGEDGVTVARYVEVVRAALDVLDLDDVDFYGMWGGGLVGLELARQARARVHALVMSDVLWFDDAIVREKQAHYTPKIEPVWYGGHLLMCWHLMRDQGLFWPWFRRGRAGIIRGEPYLDPTMIQLRVLNMLKAPEMWRHAYQAHFAYPVKEVLPTVQVPTLLCAPLWDPNYGHSEQAARETGLPFATLPDDMGRWGPAFLGFLDARR